MPVLSPPDPRQRPPRRCVDQWRHAARVAIVLMMACSAACTAPLRAASAALPPPDSIGINLSVLAAIYPQIPFVDAFKETQPWRISKQYVKPGMPITGASEIGEDGWVRSLATDERAVACAFQNISGHYPGGAYTVLYRGEGKLTFSKNAAVLASSQGRMTLQVSPTAGDNGLCVVELSTNPANPIRDIRVIMPGFENSYQTDPFFPPFIHELKPFRIVRMIGWSEANRSHVVDWTDRRSATYATQAFSVDKSTKPVTFTGVALEYQIDLANKLGADPWFLTPTMASDDYIRNMAELVHKRLRPDLHPAIEFSNEIWNGGFSDHQYAAEMGAKMNLDPQADPKASKAAFYWYALRASRMFDIWNQVYGPDARRIVHVIAGQQSRASEADIILGYQDTYKKADVLAVGGYASAFNFFHVREPQDLEAISRMSVDDVLQHLSANIETVLPAQWAANLKVAQRYGLPLTVYEGGLDLSTNVIGPPYGKPITNLMIEAGNDPRIRDIYLRLLDEIPTSKILFFNHFCDVDVPAVWGSFGALEYQQQDTSTSPKYVALMTFIRQHSSVR